MIRSKLYIQRECFFLSLLSLIVNFMKKNYIYLYRSRFNHRKVKICVHTDVDTYANTHVPLASRYTHTRSYIHTYIRTYMPASVAQFDAPSDWRPGGRGFNPRRGRQHSFVDIDHEIFSTVILSLQLIQEGQLSVSGERMCTILVNRIED